MVSGLKGEIMAEPKWITDIQLQAANLAPIASEVDSLMSQRGYAPAGEFLTNIAGQESLYGHSSMYDPSQTHSMGITQIDPIRYQDMLNQIGMMDAKYPKATRGYGADARYVNEYMQSKGEGYEDFDISKLATIEDGKYTSMSQHASNPLVNLLLTRMLLSMDKDNPIPGTSQEQANYWDTAWNKNPEKGFPKEFLEKIDLYRAKPAKPVNEVDATMDNYLKTRGAFYGKK
jgi:hypothetical protein